MDRSADLYVLSHSDMFSGLSPEALEQVRAACGRKRVSAGETLFRQEDPVGMVYLVVAGRLKVVQATSGGHQIIIGYVQAGETVGHDAVSAQRPHATSVTAVEDTTLMGWTGAALQRLTQRHPQIALNALTAVQSRYEELQTRLRELATETVERRIAHTILRLLAQAGRRTPAGIEIAFPLTRQDVAEMAGTTLHTVSRTFSAWEADGIVASGRRRVIVRRPESLGRIASDEPPGQPSPAA